MTDKYFSKRNKPYEKALNSDFWTAWLSIMRDFGNKNYLCECFPDYCSDGHPMGFSNNAVQQKIFSELGELKFDSFKTKYLSQEQMFDLIQFFYRFISKPIENWFHQYCGSDHPKSYDRSKGRYEYTIEVNKLFERFNHPYKIQKGEIKLIGSPTLDAPLISLELDIDDEHLKGLIEQAISKFYERRSSEKYIALRLIVDAFERIKTLEGEDKKKSVSKVISKISLFGYVQENLDVDLRKLTDVANDFCIRHHEISKKPIDDPDMVEFLFYLYFNYVRLILKKYNLLKIEGSRDNSNDVSF